MPSMTFNVGVTIDAAKLEDKHALTTHRQAILDSFAASLDHWIATVRLEAKQ